MQFSKQIPMGIRKHAQFVTDHSDTFIIDDNQKDNLNCKNYKNNHSAIFKIKNYLNSVYKHTDHKLQKENNSINKINRRIPNLSDIVKKQIE